MERSASTPSVVPTTRGARYPDAETQARINQILANLEDAYFDYDKAILRPDTLKVLQSNSSELRAIMDQYPDYKLTIEGHCDERGSAEYNVALGDKRAHAAMDYLVNVGIPTSQLSVISYGKERPICREQNEDCWQRNRRAHFIGSARR
jgi:peptidoglycan-associated lipoprotein